MKKFFATMLVLACCTIAGKLFAGAQDFELVNNTNHNILSVYISPSDDDDWGEDRLSGFLNSGESTEFTFTNFSETFWDIKVVYRDSKPDAVWKRLNLRTIYKMVLTDSGSGTHMTYHEI